MFRPIFKSFKFRFHDKLKIPICQYTKRSIPDAVCKTSKRSKCKKSGGKVYHNTKRSTIDVCDPPKSHVPESVCKTSKGSKCKRSGEKDSDPTRNIKGKVALVTGGTVGIGYSCVEHLLKAGCKHVCMADMDTMVGECAMRSLKREFGDDSVMYVKTDVRALYEVERAFVKCCEKWGQLDIVFNNSGILNDKLWEPTIRINVTALVLGSQLGVHYMSKKNGGNGGVVVNNASILSMQPMAGHPVYAGTKHFVRGYTMSMALPFHYEKSGVRFMTICPGVTNTQMITGAAHRAPDDEMGKEADRELGSLPSQDVRIIGKGLVHMIKHGKNGSVWVGEGGEFYEVAIPDRTTLKIKETVQKW